MSPTPSISPQRIRVIRPINILARQNTKEARVISVSEGGEGSEGTWTVLWAAARLIAAGAREWASAWEQAVERAAGAGAPARAAVGLGVSGWAWE